MVAKRRRKPVRTQRTTLLVRRTIWGLGGIALSLVIAVAVAVGLDHFAPNKVTASTNSVSTTSTTVPSLTSVTLSAVGDTNLGMTPNVPANPVAWFSPVTAALSAPIEFANLEGTFTSATTSKCGLASTNCYAFKNPISFAAAYRRVGFNVLNSANNHSHDFGAQGVTDTTKALLNAGIAQGGLPGQIAVVTENGVKVAFVDFAPYANTNNLLDSAAERELILRAKKSASLVVVYMHVGAEGPSADHVTRKVEMYVGENRGNAYAFAHAAVDDGANLVLGSGPHVLRGMEFYKGVLIAYSLGDFTNYHSFSTYGDLALSGILHVTLASNGLFQSAHFTSVRLAPSGQAVLDPTHASTEFVSQLSKADFPSTAAKISPNGTVTP